MADDIQLTDEQDEALERVWEKVEARRAPQPKREQPKAAAVRKPLPSDEEFYGTS